MNYINYLNMQLPIKAKLFALYAIISTIILFFISPDSYTHDLFYTTDSATFFMCGKAWMNSLTPYVDFADSKGPLLWLIYGIGYTLSNYNYIGVFWLSCLLYTLIYWFVFQISNIFLKSYRLSFFCSLLMSLFFFNPWFHYEIRAEDWSLLFITITIYYTCSILYTENPNKKTINRTSFIQGLCLASVIFIKYSIGAMLGTISLYFLYYLIREKKNLIMPLLFYLFGMLAIILPFTVYFLLNNNFDHFINEYFINTFLTINDSNNLNVIVRELLSIFKPRISVLFSISLIGSIMISKKIKRYNHFFTFTFLSFFLLASHHAFYYYYGICFIFSLPFCIILCTLYKKNILTDFYKLTIKISLSLFCIIIVSNYTFNSGYLRPNLFFLNNDMKTDYYNITYLMSQIPNPSIIYYEGGERGYGVAAGSLPGSKYWIIQHGATEQMKNIQLSDIKNKKADFIIIDDLKPDIDYRKYILDSIGYIKSYSAISSNTYVYSKQNLKTIDDNKYLINKWDILLKKRIIEPFKNKGNNTKIRQTIKYPSYRYNKSH